jgi:hypothetical protein
MTRSVLIDFRSDSPVESHPQVRALVDQGWAICHVIMRSARRAGSPQVLVRLVRRIPGMASLARRK